MKNKKQSTAKEILCPGNNGHTYTVKLVRSLRKTVCICVQNDLTILAKAPYSASEGAVIAFIKGHFQWIDKKIHEIKMNGEPEPFSKDELDNAAMNIKSKLDFLLPIYAEKIGVSYASVKIKKLKSRWGSCSTNKNLNFNSLLGFAPDDFIEYVVVHELCHLKQMNHSQAFRSEVEKVLPDWKKRREWSKKHGAYVMKRAFTV